MERLIGFRSFLCMAIVAICALSGAAPAAEPLRIVTEVSLGPYEHLDDNDAPGFSVEVLRRVFAAMGQDVTIEAFPLFRSWMMIARGERDGFFSSQRNRALEQICAFPDEPLKQERWVMFVRSADVGKLKFSSFDDLIGHDVVVRGSTPGMIEDWIAPDLYKFLSEHNIMVEASGSIPQLRMLAAGRVDYAVINVSSGMRNIALLGLSKKIEPLLSRSVAEAGLYVCFTKGRVSPSLVNAFSQALKQFKQTEAYQAIYRKYFP